MGEVWKSCSCGRSWPTREAYESETAFLGIQPLDGYAPPLALRNDACGSTLAEPIPFVVNERALGIREVAVSPFSWVDTALSRRQE